MLPVAAAIIAVSAASSLAQMYNSERERGATKQRLKDIERMFNEIVPPNYDIKVWDNPELVKTIPPAAFDYSRITPESFASVGQFVPEVAEFVRETNPQLIEATAAAKEGRTAQLEALRRYKDIASGQFDPMFAQKMQEASDRARIEAQGRQQAALQDAQRRGALDSGVQLAAQLQGGSESMTRGALASQLAAAEAYRNQLNALDRSASLGGDIRSSEMSEAARNAAIINDFNQRTSRNYQDYLMNRANMSNQAQRENLAREQAIADANVSQRNRFSVENQNRYNELMAKKYNMERQAREDKIAVEKYKEGLRQQNFANQMNTAQAKANQQTNMINYMNQFTRDRNQAIQGLGEGITGGLMYANRQQGPQNLTDEKPSYQNANYNQYYESRPFNDYDFNEWLQRRGN